LHSDQNIESMVSQGEQGKVWTEEVFRPKVKASSTNGRDRDPR